MRRILAVLVLILAFEPTPSLAAGAFTLGGDLTDTTPDDALTTWPPISVGRNLWYQFNTAVDSGLFNVDAASAVIECVMVSGATTGETMVMACPSGTKLSPSATTCRDYDDVTLNGSGGAPGTQRYQRRLPGFGAWYYLDVRISPAAAAYCRIRGEN